MECEEDLILIREIWILVEELHSRPLHIPAPIPLLIYRRFQFLLLRRSCEADVEAVVLLEHCAVTTIYSFQAWTNVLGFVKLLKRIWVLNLRALQLSNKHCRRLPFCVH